MSQRRNKLSYSLNALYREVGLSKQAVHQWRLRQAAYGKLISKLLPRVESIRREHPGCGLAKIYDMLNPDGIGRDRFVSVMLAMGYGVKRKRKWIRTTDSIRENYEPNLIKGMVINQINRVWQSDITYYWTGKSFMYLTFLIDVYSRRIVGYHASTSMKAKANRSALKMAFDNRKGHSLQGLIHHSDRGSQYIEKKYREMLKEAHRSMCLEAYENPYAERINQTIKDEYLRHWRIKTLSQLKTALKRAVGHYNHKRIHRSLPGKQTPIGFEQKLKNLPAEKRPWLQIYSPGNWAACRQPSYLNLNLEEPFYLCPMKNHQVNS